jgi:hypothetical protein
MFTRIRNLLKNLSLSPVSDPKQTVNILVDLKNTPPQLPSGPTPQSFDDALDAREKADGEVGPNV